MVWPGKGMSWKEFFTELKNEYLNDNIGNVAGAVTFAALLAIFPFLLFLVALAGLIIDPAQAQVLIQELGKVAPPDVAKILGDQLQKLVTDNSEIGRAHV